ncbi:MAG: hypothetical protein WD225_09795 [Ilumatobacteraceae bacterium]
MTSTAPRPPVSGSDDTGARFGPPEWILTSGMALVWGSSFLLIATAIDDVATPVVPFARVLFGALALACVPAAHHVLPRSEWPRIVFLGLVWPDFDGSIA